MKYSTRCKFRIYQRVANLEFYHARLFWNVGYLKIVTVCSWEPLPTAKGQSWWTCDVTRAFLHYKTCWKWRQIGISRFCIHKFRLINNRREPFDILDIQPHVYIFIQAQLERCVMSLTRSLFTCSRSHAIGILSLCSICSQSDAIRSKLQVQLKLPMSGFSHNW